MNEQINEHIKRLLDTARAELGATEYPPNSNRTIYGAWFGMNGQPWCQIFVAWCFEQAGLSSLWFNENTKASAYVPWAMTQAQNTGRWVTSGYVAGDVPIFDFDGTRRRAQHIGICERVDPNGTLVCIEGNTGNSSDDNGGAVMRRNRDSRFVTGAFRPRYAELKKDDFKKEDFKKEDFKKGDFNYVVQAGDTLSGIAVKVYGSGQSARYVEIMKYNGLSSSVIRAGQVLRIPQ